MATKKKTQKPKQKGPEVHIRISGPQGTRKSGVARAIAEIVGAEVDGAYVPAVERLGTMAALALCDELFAMTKRLPYQTQRTRIVITTTNEGEEE